MENTITVLMVEPHKHPYLKTVPHSLENLQALVGDYITVTYPWEDEIGLIAGDNSLSDERLEWNRIIDDYNIIRGNFYLVGLTRDDFTDIPMDMAKKYAELFWMPESFVNIGGSLMVIKEDDGSFIGCVIVRLVLSSSTPVLSRFIVIYRKPQREATTMTNLDKLARTYRLPQTTTPEDLACNWRHTLNFGNKVLLAGYYYRNGENSYFAAVYTHTNGDLSCEGEIRLTAVSEEFFPDEGNAIQWAITKANTIKG